MVRWPAVISNPAIHLYFEGAQLLSELFLKAPKKYKRMKEKEKILWSETLLSVPVELERSPNTAAFIACVAGAGYFFLCPKKTGARYVGYRV